MEASDVEEDAAAGEVMGGQGGDDAEAGGGQGPAAFDAPSHSFGSFLPLRAASAEGAATKSTRASRRRQDFMSTWLKNKLNNWFL